MSLPFVPADQTITEENVLNVLKQKETCSINEIAHTISQAQGHTEASEISSTQLAVEHVIRKLRAEEKIIIVSDAGEEMRFAFVDTEA
jgi:hypothetical protein